MDGFDSSNFDLIVLVCYNIHPADDLCISIIIQHSLPFASTSSTSLRTSPPPHHQPFFAPIVRQRQPEITHHRPAPPRP